MNPAIKNKTYINDRFILGTLKIINQITKDNTPPINIGIFLLFKDSDINANTGPPMAAPKNIAVVIGAAWLSDSW